MIFRALCKHLGQVLHELAWQKECQIVEGRLMSDHVHIINGMLFWVRITPREKTTSKANYNPRFLIKLRTPHARPPKSCALCPAFHNP